MSLFTVGDEVETIMGGDGIVVVINDFETYPVVVTCDDMTITFTLEGLSRKTDKHPSMWLKSTGHPPFAGIEEFEYPLYRENIMDGDVKGFVVKFTDFQCGVVVHSPITNKLHGRVTSNRWANHEDKEHWKVCEKPKWRPTKPTWCWVWNESEDNKIRRVVVPGDNELFYILPNNGLVYYKHAEPCLTHEIPKYWPEEWV